MYKAVTNCSRSVFDSVALIISRNAMSTLRRPLEAVLGQFNNISAGSIRLFARAGAAMAGRNAGCNAVKRTASLLFHRYNIRYT